MTSITTVIERKCNDNAHSPFLIRCRVSVTDIVKYTRYHIEDKSIARPESRRRKNNEWINSLDNQLSAQTP